LWARWPAAKISEMGITPRQLQQMQDRLAGVKRSPAARGASRTPDNGEVKRHEVILGVDPSLRGTGFGIIHVLKPHSIALTHGTIRIPASWERSRCLAKIHDALREVILQHQPTVCVIEGLFYAQNLQTALIMGEARGASLTAVAQSGLDVFEIAPRKMKQAIVGYGAAQKGAVAKMVQRMLHLTEEPDPDAGDALALAIAFSQEMNRFALSLPKRV
jgi:crossover junction endodeoxyribonuclease RuvC